MINSLEIDGYKCFNNFKLDGLSQINVISGSNNVGKTALLESISIIKNSNNLRFFRNNIISIFIDRDLELTDLEKYLENINFFISDNEISIKIEHKFIDELTIEQLNTLQIKRLENSDELLIMYHNNNIKDIMPFSKDISDSYIGQIFKLRKMPSHDNAVAFVDSSRPKNFELTNLYSHIQDLGKQDIFLKYLQIIDKNINRVEPQIREGKSFIKVTLKNPQRSLFSSELGEGTNRFIEVLCILLANKNGTVLIDEIENGIHYTKLYDIWKAVIEIVQKENIQLFVTTHDRESIEALIKASQDTDYNKVSSIKLFRNKENKIESIVNSFELLEYGIDVGAEIR